MYKFIFAIFLLCLINSKVELGHSVAEEINTNASNQLIFNVFSDIELDSEPDLDPLVEPTNENNRITQLTYLSKHSKNTNLSLLNNKFQYLCPRAPPFARV